jgi:Fur family transcriptional regulator, stress-responsive regulator
MPLLHNNIHWQTVGGSARHEARIGRNHRHLVCRVRGGVTGIDCVVGAAPCPKHFEHPERDGFGVDEAENVFWGTCGSCRISPSVEEM